MNAASVAVIIVFVFSILLIPVMILTITLITRKILVDFTVEGMSFTVDKGLKISQTQIQRILSLYLSDMGPHPFNTNSLRKHIKKITCTLRNRKLKSNLRSGTFNGLAHSAKKIEIACDQEFWNEDDYVLMNKTAFEYEITNACIMGLVKDGYYIAMAEKFIDPYDEKTWSWFKDLTGDKKITAEDVKLWKEKREPYDAAFKEHRKITSAIGV